MSLKILHTSDLHLGLKFSTYPDEVRDALIEARFEALVRLVDKANEEKCDLMIVAGDLFDRVTVAKRDIRRAAGALGEFQGSLVAVLPGNHDYFARSEDSLWTTFCDAMANNTIVMREPRVVRLEAYDIDACLYPAPCHAKRSPGNAIGWIRDAEKDESVTHHVAVAHGSLEGVSPDFEGRYYPMTMAELEQAGMDLWLLGHTHVQYPARPGSGQGVFFPATPEPDGFGCDHEGKAWVLVLDEKKKLTARSLSTGSYRFLHDEVSVSTASDLQALEKKYAAGKHSSTLLKLRLSGRVAGEVFEHLGDTKSRISKKLFHLAWNDDEVVRRVTAKEIERTFTKGSFPHRLLKTLARRQEDAEALQDAHDLIMEVK
ncbi:MAG: DNA repair exonuclease [Pseudomonadota bacterium]